MILSNTFQVEYIFNFFATKFAFIGVSECFDCAQQSSPLEFSSVPHLLKQSKTMIEACCVHPNRGAAPFHKVSAAVRVFFYVKIVVGVPSETLRE